MGLQPRPRRTSYEPQYTGPQLPAVDDFRLDNILHGELLSESQQLAESTIAVSRNYQADLRREIRNKLHIEQKLQYKNIDVAKLAHTLNKTLESRTKRITRVLAASSEEGPENGLDTEVSRLLELSVNAGQRIRGVTYSLARLEERINGPGSLKKLKTGSDYPFVASLLNKNGSQGSALSKKGRETNDTAEGAKTDLLDYRERSSPKANHSTLEESFKLNDSIAKKRSETAKLAAKQPIGLENGSAKSSGPETYTTTIALQTPPSSSGFPEMASSSPKSHLLGPFHPEPSSLPPLDAIRQSTPLPEPELLDPEQFEQFMSSAIYTYRKLQQNKYGNSDMFMSEQLHDQKPQLRQDSVDSTVSSNGSVLKYPYEAGNPLNLLYLSLITSAYQGSTSKDTMGPSMGPFSAVKSLATVMLTPQISHFKKLRINGSPITSATFQKLKDKQQNCECEPAVSEASNGDVSPARRALVESLALDSLRLVSDDDTWNSSGLVSETESDQIGTSESSEVDSSSSDDEIAFSETIAGSTNQYYSSLKSDLKLKKKLLKKTMEKHKRKHLKRASRLKDLSPTPKHKPSHHTLQPKSSILKMPKGVPKPQTGVSVDQASDSVAHSAAETAEREGTVSGPLQVSDFAAAGTFLKAEESSDEYEVASYRGVDPVEAKGLQSLLKLRGFLQT